MIRSSKAIFIFNLFSWIFSCLCLQAESDALEASRILFQDSLSRLESDYGEKVEELGLRYAEKIEEIGEIYRQQGDLDGLLLVNSQQEAVKKSETLPDVPEDDDTALSSVRKVYDQSLDAIVADHTQKVVHLQKVYVTYLKQLQTKLTQENNIEGALGVREAVLKIEDSTPLVVDNQFSVPADPKKVFRVEWGPPRHKRQVVSFFDGFKKLYPIDMNRDVRRVRGGLKCSRGRAVVEGLGDVFHKAVQESGEWTLIADVMTSKENQSGPARILSYSKDSQLRNFTLGQQGDNLVLRLRTSESNENGTAPELVLGKLRVDDPSRVVFSYSPRGAICFLDGKEVELSEITGELTTWEAMPFLIGNEAVDSRGWEGVLKGFSTTNQALTKEQAQASSIP